MEQRTKEWYDIRKYKFTSSNMWRLMTEPQGKSNMEKWEDAALSLKESKKKYDEIKNKETKTAINLSKKIIVLEASLPTLEANKDVIPLSETAQEYVIEKIVEEIGGFIPEVETNAMVYGREMEKDAIFWYKAKTGFDVESVGFLEVSEFFGGSPDAIVLQRDLNSSMGGLEVKCPYSSVNHVWHCLIKNQEYFKKFHKEYYWQCISHMITLDVPWCDFVSFDPRIDSDLGLFIFRAHYDADDASKLLNKIVKALEFKNEIKTQLGLCA